MQKNKQIDIRGYPENIALAQVYDDTMITHVPLGAKQYTTAQLQTAKETNQFKFEQLQQNPNTHQPNFIQIPPIASNDKINPPDFTIGNSSDPGMPIDPYYLLLGQGSPNHTRPRIPLSQGETVERRERFAPSLLPIADIQPQIKNPESTVFSYQTEIEIDDAINEWSNLTINNINTSFKAVANLRSGYKLKVIDNNTLAMDDSYFYMFRNKKNGQSRNVIITFLDHLLKQTMQNIKRLIDELSVSMDNVHVLTDLIFNMATFIHHFDKIKIVYKNDNVTCIQLDVILNNFVNCYSIVLREMSKKK